MQYHALKAFKGHGGNGSRQRRVTVTFRLALT